MLINIATASYTVAAVAYLFLAVLLLTLYHDTIITKCDQFALFQNP